MTVSIVGQAWMTAWDHFSEVTNNAQPMNHLQIAHVLSDPDLPSRFICVSWGKCSVAYRNSLWEMNLLETLRNRQQKNAGVVRVSHQDECSIHIGKTASRSVCRCYANPWVFIPNMASICDSKWRLRRLGLARGGNILPRISGEWTSPRVDHAYKDDSYAKVVQPGHITNQWVMLEP